jgi:hypothetical protein
MKLIFLYFYINPFAVELINNNNNVSWTLVVIRTLGSPFHEAKHPSEGPIKLSPTLHPKCKIVDGVLHSYIIGVT